MYCNVAFLQFVLAIHGQSQLWNSFPINSIASCGWCWGITLVWLDRLASAACLPCKCPAVHIPERLPAPGAMAAATKRLLSHAGRQSAPAACRSAFVVRLDAYGSAGMGILLWCTCRLCRDSYAL